MDEFRVEGLSHHIALIRPCRPRKPPQTQFPLWCLLPFSLMAPGDPSQQSQNKHRLCTHFALDRANLCLCSVPDCLSDRRGRGWWCTSAGCLQSSQANYSLQPVKLITTRATCRDHVDSTGVGVLHSGHYAPERKG